MDVGTVPHKKGIMNLLKGFSVSHNIGGVTGFLAVNHQLPSEEEGQFHEEDHSNCFSKFLCSVSRAQEYEYIMGNFL